MSDILHYTFSDSVDELKVAILLKDSAFNYQALNDNYIKHLGDIDKKELIAFNLKYVNNKITAKAAKEYLIELLDQCISLGIDTLYIADATYFKYAAKVTKTESLFGEIVQCKLDAKYEHISMVLGVNYQATFYDPKMKEKLSKSLKTLEQYYKGTYVKPGTGIIKHSKYVDSVSDTYVTDVLTAYLSTSEVFTCDTETTGLRFDKSHIYTIAFAVDEGTGIALRVYDSHRLLIGSVLETAVIKNKIKLVYHNSLFDIKMMIYKFFMKNSNDFLGMFRGINILTRNLDDTQIMTYLCTNSTAGNVLGLKPNTQEFTGDYAEDVKDVTAVPLQDLLTYNLKDTLATFWLYNKRSKELVTEDQVEIYEQVFKPAIPVLLEMMLIGLPLDLAKVDSVEQMLLHAKNDALKIIHAHPLVKKTEYKLKIKRLKEVNAKLKKQTRTFSDIPDIEFNPGSGLQKQVLFYEVMKLPIIDTTASKQASTSGGTIKKLITHCASELDKDLLLAFKDYQDTDKILGTFIKAFKEYAFTRKDGTVWLNGNQKLGGTLSGRLSSNEPNLANLPSNSKYGKAIKSCFVAPEGWLFCGSDYAALEDRVVAILSGDPNKRRIFTDGIDGHCLNAYGYFNSQMPDIDPNNKDSLNSIKDKYPDLRQDSKAPTFALNYNGTYLTLHSNCGIPLEQSIEIEAGHKELYKVMHAWSEGNKIKMAKDGFVTGAYGLKIRTPALARALIDSRITPSVVKAEFRSGNNGITQSHGLMTTVAGTMFKERLDASPYRFQVLLINFIHDAIYLLMQEDLEVIQWVNKNLIECMEEAGDDQVKGFPGIPLSANLDIGYSWDKQYELSNGASEAEILELITKLQED